MADDWTALDLANAIELDSLPGQGTPGGAQVVVVSGRKAHVYTWRGSTVAPPPYNGHEFKAWGRWVRIGTMNWRLYLEWKAAPRHVKY
jgi:hypothetical protein